LNTTEIVDCYGITYPTQTTTWLNLLEAQNITKFIFRLNSYGEWDDSPPTMTGINKAKQMITAANARGIWVAIDLHTWYTTWQNNWQDSVSGYAANRQKYIDYVEATIDAFSGYDVSDWMLMNEPVTKLPPPSGAYIPASTSENNFILDVVAAAQASTVKPVSVRFAGGYNPETGYFSNAIDTATDFLCRNTYWDARNPSQTVYGSSESSLLAAIATAHGAGKELWITESGYHKPTGTSWTTARLESQRSFAEAMISWSGEHEVDLYSLWVSCPTAATDQATDYNLFTAGSWTPHSAWYELVNPGAPSPPPTPPNVVVLNQPNSLETLDSLTVKFNYTATFYGCAISNSSLWANKTGTWQRLAWNSSVITNATMHTISYAFSVEATYIWNVQVFNSTDAHWATANRTFTIDLAPPPDDPPAYGATSVSTTVAGASALFECVWDDDVSLSYGILSTDESGSWANRTKVPLLAPHSTLSDSFTLPASVGVVVHYRFYANDTANQWNVTSIRSLTTTSVQTTLPSFTASREGAIVYGSICQFQSVTSAVGAQSDMNKTLYLIVDEGQINGTCGIAIYRDRGIIQYAATHNVNLTINHDSYWGYDLIVSGATCQKASEYVYTVSVTAGSIVTIQWHWRLESFIDNYMLLAMGIAGIVLMVSSPSWLALKIRKDGLDEETIERLAYAFLLFLIGFGLVIVWLWR